MWTVLPYLVVTELASANASDNPLPATQLQT